jgi:hypothetical protein
MSQVCRIALLAFPAEFRARQGRALLQTLAADVRGSSAAISVPRLIADVADAVRAGIAERVARRRRAVLETTGRGPLGRSGGPTGRWVVDLRHAWRSISMHPASSAATVMVFSLGVGLASAMFALGDPYFLRPLPYADPDALAVLRLGPHSGGRGAPPPTPPTLDAWRARTDLFEAWPRTRGVLPSC